MKFAWCRNICLYRPFCKLYKISIFKRFFGSFNSKFEFQAGLRKQKVTQLLAVSMETVRMTKPDQEKTIRMPGSTSRPPMQEEQFFINIPIIYA